MSFISNTVLASAIAAVLSGSALAQAGPRPTGTRADMHEVPDEKGRTPSDIAADYERQTAAAAARQAREADALEKRRQAVSVPSDSDECLAYHRSERRCLVTAGDLNRRLASDTRWAEAMGDSGNQAAQILKIRSMLMASLLEEQYRNALAANPGHAGRPAEEAWRANIAVNTDAAAEAKQRALFRKHAALFAPRREVRAEYLVASDSVFLDSLVDCMIDTGRAAGTQAQGPSGKGCASGPAFQWFTPRPGELPRQWERAASKLRKGEVSEVIRCPFGWFAAAATQVTVIPGKTYEESRPLLAYMLGFRDTPGEAVDSMDTGVAAGSPEGNPEGRDGPMLRVWLLPRAAAGNGKPSPSPAWPDTARLGALRLRLADLPAQVGCEARALLQKDDRAILKSRFGTWYLQAEKRPSAPANRKEAPCGQDPMAPPPKPSIVDLAAEALAGKERDFKLAFLASQPRSGEGSGTAAAPPPLAQWIAENVTLEDRALNRL